MIETDSGKMNLVTGAKEMLCVGIYVQMKEWCMMCDATTALERIAPIFSALFNISEFLDLQNEGRTFRGCLRILISEESGHDVVRDYDRLFSLT